MSSSVAVALEEGERTFMLPQARDANVAPGGRAWSTKARAGGLLAVALVGAVGVAAWRAGASADVARSVGDAMQASVARHCVELKGVRLVDGEGPLDPLVGEEAVTATQCMEKCRGSPDCEQAIFSSGNTGCYRFKKSKAAIFQGDSRASSFDSSVCSSGSEASLQNVVVQAKAQQMLASKKAQLAEVKQNWTDAKKRAKDLVDTLTLTQKVAILHGSPDGMGYAGFVKSPGINGMVNLQMNDGPQGYNAYQPQLAGTSTQLPCLLAVAASFSREVSAAYAGSVADEFVLKGSNVLLGPDVEVMRAPLTGRSFETISGEDPYLGSQLVAQYVKEVQKRGIIATVKHWLDNNQEIYRQTMDVEVADRTQHEVYMAPFKAAFEAGAGAVMCSYNRVYKDHACQNKKLLKQLLRDDLGFEGYVVSDWGATHDATASANNGLDIEMPAGGTFLKLEELVNVNKTIKEETIDEMATHVLTSMYVTGLFDNAFPLEYLWAPRVHILATSHEHRVIAQKTIIESTVLLKNEDATLPLGSGAKIAMVGKFCDHSFEKSYPQGSVFSGGGSGFVNTTRTVTPLQGLKAAGASVDFSKDGKAAKGADVVVICVAGHSEEGWDRKNLTMPQAKDLIADVKKHGSEGQKIVVLAVVPGAVETEWVDEVDAVLLMFMPGEQVGTATAALLTGKEAPSGHLPVSFPKAGEKRFEQADYPGVCPNNTWCENMTANFSEGVLVGYRWNDAKAIPSAYPFGFGLSYTDFTFADFDAKCLGEEAMVTLKVKNTGARDGKAVPQLYVGFPSLAPAVRQLRGFQKVEVAAGAEADVVFSLSEEDWSFYSEDKGRWVSAIELGEKITVSVGSDSANLEWHHTLSCRTTEVSVRK